MAHWAEIDENNIVLRVLVGDNNDPNGDEGYSWFVERLGGTWVQTSYNAYAGKRIDPETSEETEEPGFRKNYAGIGFIYDPVRDAFMEQKPFDSWTLNEDTCIWEAPTPKPTDGKLYKWSEDDLNWQLITP